MIQKSVKFTKKWLFGFVEMSFAASEMSFTVSEMSLAILAEMSFGQNAQKKSLYYNKVAAFTMEKPNLHGFQ